MILGINDITLKLTNILFLIFNYPLNIFLKFSTDQIVLSDFNLELQHV